MPVPRSKRKTRVDVEEISTRPELNINENGLPQDLAQIPGLCVVSGAERVRAGASASSSHYQL